MTVISGRKIIFCEGKQASLDFALLNRVVEDIAGDKPTIVPAGGKFTVSTFAQGYFFPDEPKSRRYIIFRDRDFDACPTEDRQLIKMANSRGKIFALLTYPACVENYLIDAKLIDQYWTLKYVEKQENPSSKWGHGESPGVQVIEDWIEFSARELQGYQSVRWALGDLLQMSQARRELKTTWTGGSGTLPKSLTVNHCAVQASNLVREFGQAVEFINSKTFGKCLGKYLALFSQAEFWQNQDYLIWFHGKDIQKMMQRQQPNYPPLKNQKGGGFFEWAITQLDITVYPDLMELREKIEQL
ncbi:hypothetical protein [Spirulina subsalsa]|uniref:hypothetical protein n=1 Tax=Spirulina subsalsa TaxID=54311 RepID=UPI0002DCB908|nr:hypothetical protein [Spirulina subsalsa]